MCGRAKECGVLVAFGGGLMTFYCDLRMIARLRNDMMNSKQLEPKTRTCNKVLIFSLLSQCRLSEKFLAIMSEIRQKSAGFLTSSFFSPISQH